MKVKMKAEDIEKNKSHVVNCHLEPRDDQKEPMFSDLPERIEVQLDGYAIIPKEKYFDMQSQLKERKLRLKLYEDIFEGIYATAFQEHIQGTVRLNEVKKAVNYAYKRVKDGQ
jgi:hypothetical protein